MPLSEVRDSPHPAAPPPDHHGCWQRDDGLFDIEAHLVDTKSYPFENMDRAPSPLASRCTACGAADGG
jgi:hypothetical protein